MSELRVDNVEKEYRNLVFSGITTFSSTGSVTLPVGTEAQRPSSPSVGQVRVLQGEIGYAMEYYNGTSWVTV
jgi:hypothetical protein